MKLGGQLIYRAKPSPLTIFLLLAIAPWGSVATTATAAEPLPAPGLFPCVLPWDDATPGVANLSGWLQTPAGKFGNVRAGDGGHLYAGKERIRLFGVDLAFSANFPQKEEAGKVAARMAKFGINIVRFHIMDMRRFPEGLLARNGADTRDLDPEALDRLDYFIDQLNRNGIYVYLCLLNYRPINAADGLPKEIEQLGAPYQQRHVVGFYDSRILDLQKEYARKLLTHRNTYTGMTYAESPAVAFVEINNENGLIHSWLGGEVDRLPEVFLPELQRQWNQWLRGLYGATDKLRQAWGGKEEPLGDEILANASFSRGVERWLLEQHEGAKATATAGDDIPDALRGQHSARVAVTKAGTQSWHIRFEQPGIAVQSGRHYTLSFWAKSQEPCVLGASVEQNHESWANLGLSTKATLAKQWKQFRFTFTVDKGDDSARVVFDPSMQPNTCWLAGVSLRPGGVHGLGTDQRTEDASVRLLSRATAGECTAEMQRDWMRFLWDTEDHYWQEMNGYLKKELKIKPLVIGTIVGCSAPNLMAKLDCIDTHAYWQHPVFPGRPWDPENWIVHNRSMVNAPGGLLPDLALRRVLDKPFCVTEYGHPAPNTFVSEGHLLRAAYSALQDWDYISASRYSHDTRWDLQRIRNFFDIDQHPTKMLTLIPAAAMFLRGDVEHAQIQVVAALSKDREIQALQRSGPWDLVHAGHVGVSRETALMHRTAIAVEGQSVPADALRPDQVKPQGTRVVSDTGQLVWDLTSKERGVVTVNSPRSKAVIGYGRGLKFELGGVTIEPGPTLQDGWSAITVTVMKGDLSSLPSQLLITATGYAENTAMGWKNPEKSSVGKDWGRAPTLVEGVPAVITFPFPANGTEVWALDERGQRRSKLDVRADAHDHAVVDIGPQHRTLWYEVSAK